MPFLRLSLPRRGSGVRPGRPRRSLPFLRTLATALRDPLAQVRVMAGCGVLLLIMGHVRARHPGSEGKNSATASPESLLLAGTSLTWRDDFASAPRHEPRPHLILEALPAPGRPQTSLATALLLPVRPLMQQAASRPPHYLDRSLRTFLSTPAIKTPALTVQIRWSGAARGNASLIARQQRLAPSTAHTTLIIGNGSRSPDGSITLLDAGRDLSHPHLRITLIGQPGHATPAQLEALGELLNDLEALTGQALTIQQSGPAPVGQW